MRAVPVAAGRTSASAANATTQKDFRPAMERFYRSAKAFSIVLLWQCAPDKNRTCARGLGNRCSSTELRGLYPKSKSL